MDDVILVGLAFLLIQCFIALVLIRRRETERARSARAPDFAETLDASELTTLVEEIHRTPRLVIVMNPATHPRIGSIEGVQVQRSSRVPEGQAFVMRDPEELLVEMLARPAGRDI